LPWKWDILWLAVIDVMIFPVIIIIGVFLVPLSVIVVTPIIIILIVVTLIVVFLIAPVLVICLNVIVVIVNLVSPFLDQLSESFTDAVIGGISIVLILFIDNGHIAPTHILLPDLISKSRSDSVRSSPTVPRVEDLLAEILILRFTRPVLTKGVNTHAVVAVAIESSVEM
jgi:hypothetical protein